MHGRRRTIIAGECASAALVADGVERTAEIHVDKVDRALVGDQLCDARHRVGIAAGQLHAEETLRGMTLQEGPLGGLTLLR